MRKILRMTRSRAIIIVSVLAIAMSGLFAGPASAAPNGQQVGICGSGNAAHVKFQGYNQDRYPTTLYMDFNGGCPVSWGWWWKGNIQIRFYDWNWNEVAAGSCWVPENNSEDVYWC